MLLNLSSLFKSPVTFSFLFFLLQNLLNSKSANVCMQYIRYFSSWYFDETLKISLAKEGNLATYVLVIFSFFQIYKYLNIFTVLINIYLYIIVVVMYNSLLSIYKNKKNGFFIINNKKKLLVYMKQCIGRQKMLPNLSFSTRAIFSILPKPT